MPRRATRRPNRRPRKHRASRRASKRPLTRKRRRSPLASKTRRRVHRRRLRGGKSNERDCQMRAREQPESRWKWVQGAPNLDAFDNYFNCKRGDRGSCCQEQDPNQAKCSICLDRREKCKMKGDWTCAHEVCEECFGMFPTGHEPCPECRAPRSRGRAQAPPPLQLPGTQLPGTRFTITPADPLSPLYYAPYSPTWNPATSPPEWRVPEYNPVSPAPYSPRSPTVPFPSDAELQAELGLVNETIRQWQERGMSESSLGLQMRDRREWLERQLGMLAASPTYPPLSPGYYPHGSPLSPRSPVSGPHSPTFDQYIDSLTPLQVAQEAMADINPPAAGAARNPDLVPYHGVRLIELIDGGNPEVLEYLRGQGVWGERLRQHAEAHRGHQLGGGPNAAPAAPAAPPAPLSAAERAALEQEAEELEGQIFQADEWLARLNANDPNDIDAYNENLAEKTEYENKLRGIHVRLGEPV